MRHPEQSNPAAWDVLNTHLVICPGSVLPSTSDLTKTTEPRMLTFFLTMFN